MALMQECSIRTTAMAMTTTTTRSALCSHFDTQRSIKASIPDGQCFKEHAESYTEKMFYVLINEKST